MSSLTISSAFFISSNSPKALRARAAYNVRDFLFTHPPFELFLSDSFSVLGKSPSISTCILPSLSGACHVDATTPVQFLYVSIPCRVFFATGEERKKPGSVESTYTSPFAKSFGLWYSHLPSVSSTTVLDSLTVPVSSSFFVCVLYAVILHSLQ